MAKDIRIGDPNRSELNGAHKALQTECSEQSRNALYTSTSFYIWLRCLKLIRTGVWILAVVASGAAASTAISKLEGLESLVAGLALLGVILPGTIKATKLEETISQYEKAAAKFKHAENSLRRAADVWSNKAYAEFEVEAKRALAELDSARKSSLTPPEWCFKSAQKKVQSGDYDPD